MGLRYGISRPYHAVDSRTNTYHDGQQSTGATDAPWKVFPGETESRRPGPNDANIALWRWPCWDPRQGELSIRAAMASYEDMRSDYLEHTSRQPAFVITTTVNTPPYFANPYRGIVIRFLNILDATAKFQLSSHVYSAGLTLRAP